MVKRDGERTNLYLKPQMLSNPINDPKTPNKPSNNPISVSNVRVIFRIRPFLPQEFTPNSNKVSCISLLDQESQSQDEVAVYLKDLTAKTWATEISNYEKTPSSIMNSAKKSVTLCTSVKVERPSINQDARHTTQSRTFADSFRNLLDDEAAFDSFKEDNDRREVEHEVNKAALETYQNLTVEPLSKRVNSQIKNVSKDVVLQSPLREALTPININGNSTLAQTPFSATCSTNNGLQQNGTPLDKFSARSSAIKNCLVQEYIDLLNNASREELLELKGIGEKRADYIIELREESPLKSLSDLEKIGLSLKQAKNLFTKSAKKLFEYKEDSTMD